jgi:hypothetical protein
LTDEEEVPPAVTCPRCGRSECAGCAPAPEVAGSIPSLVWESRRGGSWLGKLFHTATASSTEPERIFGELSDGKLAPALAFAAVSETLAIASLAGAGVLALAVMAPDLALRALADPHVLGLLGGAAAGGVVVMIVLHAAWGLCLELGARGSEQGARFTQGLRFGLYACGWDLLTSPAGIVHGLVARGPVRAWSPIIGAVQAPRIAMRAYLERCRHLDPAAQRRGKRLTLFVLGVAFFGITTALAVSFVQLLAR